MKISLLQLPLQGHDFYFSKENIPLAAGYLKAAGTKPGIDIQLVPSHLMCYGSDQAILKFLVHERPDLVGMSCYQWNVERSLFLAQQIKRELPACLLILGGPEVTPDNAFLLQHRVFDIGVVGEGERPWEALLESFPHVADIPGLLLPRPNGQWHFNAGHSSNLPPQHRPSPFLSGCLDSHLEKVLWLETFRGCVHHCAYCYYHKQFDRLRPFPLQRIIEEVSRARVQGIEEIVFLDPCFTRRPLLRQMLDALATINNDHRLRFYGESNAEDIDQEKAERLAGAGFIKMEVGLQSIKASTLKRIHRRFHPGRFLEGVKYLRENGIETMVDVIAGLPGDTLSDICHSMDWTLEHEACDSLMLYPLSLLPGTELRRRAGELKLSALPYPPYFVIRGPGLEAGDICRAFHHYEQCMAEDVNPLEIPMALDAAREDVNLPGGLWHSVAWDAPEQGHSLSALQDRSSYALTVKLSRQVLLQPALWQPALREYVKDNPFALLSIEVPADAFPAELNPLWQVAGEHRHIVDRDYTVTHTPYRSFFLFSRHRNFIWKWPDPRESQPFPLPDGQKISRHPTCLVAAPEGDSMKWLVDHIAERYSTLPGFRIWEPPDERP